MKRTMRGRTGLILLALSVFTAVAACGDDDDTEAATDDTTAAESEYCVLAAEMDASDDFPTVEQLEALIAAAPDEIKAEIDAAGPVFIEAIEAGDPVAAFEDPVMQENLPAIEAYEADVCGLEEDGDGEDEEVSIAPEHAEYCGISKTLDEQESFPTVEQLEAIKAAAPEEIAEAVTTVADAFIAATEAGDIGAAFEDPEVEAAFEVIEPFDEEKCGISSGEDDEEEQDPASKELDPEAARVDVTATEFAFDFAASYPAGRTSFVMTNAGEQRHVLDLFLIEEGKTLDDVKESEGEEGIVDGTELSSDTAAAGEEAVLTVDLVPGEYGYICYLPTPEGESHIDLGMIGSFTVS